MKKLLFLFSICFILFSCSSDDTSENTSQNGTLIFSSYYVDKLSTGEDNQKAQPLEIIHIWEADGKDFDFSKSQFDLLEGFLFDKTQNKSFEANYTYLKKWNLTEELKAGKYVIYVLYGDNSHGIARFGHSYTTFEIKPKETTILYKYLRKGTNYPNLSYHKW